MITSRQNGLVKRLRALRDKKQRDAAREYIVEGVKSVKEAIALGECVVAVAATVKGAVLLGDTALTPEILSDDVFKSVSEEVSPQGVLAIVKKPAETLGEISEKCVFLDGVSDPANVGAVIRSAAAFGYGAVLIADGADAYAGKAVRASMGGIFRVKVFSDARENLLKAVKVPLVVADMYGEPLGATEIPEKHCLIIGNEAHGVSDELKARAKVKVAIPMQNGMESLNAAVSAGILMYATSLKS